MWSACLLQAVRGRAAADLPDPRSAVRAFLDEGREIRTRLIDRAGGRVDHVLQRRQSLGALNVMAPDLIVRALERLYEVGLADCDITVRPRRRTETLLVWRAARRRSPGGAGP